MFKINQIEFEYFDHSYNSTITNERCVEVPLGFYFLDKFDRNKIIEIGAVTPYYTNCVYHKVYDVYDPYDKSDRTDLTESDFSFDGYNVLSISTIEHIGFGDYGLPKDDFKALKFLKRIINESRNYLITFPWGYNKIFDNQFLDSKINFSLMKRVSQNEWVIDSSKNLENVVYNHPYVCGNALLVITNIKL